MSEKITAVMLNWARPYNVDRIVAGWRLNPRLAQGIVWNNNASNPPSFLPCPKVLLINASQPLSLNSRFVAACLAENECVLIQDDDLELPPQAIERLYEAWRLDPQVIHGIFGRSPEPDGTYNYRPSPPGECPIVLTRAMVVSRSLIRFAIHQLQEFEELQNQGTPPGNGEDIIFSYSVMRHSGRLNRIHQLPVTELPDDSAIWRRPGHATHRSDVIRACISWLERNRKNSIEE